MTLFHFLGHDHNNTLELLYHFICQACTYVAIYSSVISDINYEMAASRDPPTFAEGLRLLSRLLAKVHLAKVGLDGVKCNGQSTGSKTEKIGELPPEEKDW